jgi:death on curing protein
MTEPLWLDRRMIMALHDEALAMFGGTAGLRDEGLLDSAIVRPQNRFAYEPESTLFDLAASLCHGLCKNHAFLDGNKRTALLSARAFLYVNGWVFEPKEADEVEIMVGVADGSVDEGTLARWFRDFSTRRAGSAPRRK